MKRIFLATLVFAGLCATVTASFIVLSPGKASAAAPEGCALLAPVDRADDDPNCLHMNDANGNGKYFSCTIADHPGTDNCETNMALLKSDFITNLNYYANRGQPYQKISAAWMEGKLGGSDWAARINSSSVTLQLTSYHFTTNSEYVPQGNNNGYVYYPYGDSDTAKAIIIRANGVIYDVIKVDCGNLVDASRPLPPPNHPPTGSFVSLVCNAAAETYTIKVNFRDQDVPNGSTTAQLRGVGGAVYFTSSGTSATWTISTKTLLPSYFPVGLWVKDVGSSANGAYVKVATHAIANCNPQGSIGALSCDTVSVRLWDPNNPNGNIQYYLTINGTKSGPTTLNGGQGAGAVTVSVLNRAGFDPWKPNAVTLIGVDGQTNGQVTIGSVTLNSICDSISCGGTSMPSALVAGEQYQFQVWVQVNGPKITGPPGARFSSVHIESLNTSSNYSLSGSDLYSSKIPFTPQTAGTYTLTWIFSGGEANPPTKTCTQNNIRIAYEPYFTVVGGDASAGQGFGAGCVANTTADIAGETLDTGGKYFGASSRQAAIASGQINQFATDTTNFVPSNLGGSSDGVGGNQPSGLAFANIDPSGTKYPQGTTYGAGYVTAAGQAWCASDYAGSVTGPTTATFLPTTGSISNLTTDALYKLTGDQTINGNITLKPGVHVTILVTGGNVYLNGNVDYSGYGSIDKVPQFTLIVDGGNLYIDHTVSKLHGTYVAQPTNATNGILFTCATGLTSPSTAYNTCNNALTFYGAVSAGELVPGRMQGNLSKTSSISNAPAEQFVYTPELWLGSVENGSVGCAVDPAQAQCLYQSYTSLPPVF